MGGMLHLLHRGKIMKDDLRPKQIFRYAPPWKFWHAKS